jgi:hypothetical protein
LKCEIKLNYVDFNLTFLKLLVRALELFLVRLFWGNKKTKTAKGIQIECMRKQQFGARFGRTGSGSTKNEKRVGRSSAENGLRGKLGARSLSLVWGGS